LKVHAYPLDEMFSDSMSGVAVPSCWHWQQLLRYYDKVQAYHQSRSGFLVRVGLYQQLRKIIEILRVIMSVDWCDNAVLSTRAFHPRLKKW